MSITVLSVALPLVGIAVTQGKISDGHGNTRSSPVAKVAAGILFGLAAHWTCNHIDTYKAADRAATTWVAKQLTSSTPQP